MTTLRLLGYSHQELETSRSYWTAKEISQQPLCWEQTDAIIQENHLKVEAFLSPILAQDNLRIILTGAGTSSFAGLTIAPALSGLIHKRVEAIPTTDIVSNSTQYLAEDVPTLVVSFARSGDSPESVAAVDIAIEHLKKCYHLIITCNSNGHLYKEAQQRENRLALLMPQDTNDNGFAMTSSFSSMMLCAFKILSLHSSMDLSVTTIAQSSKEVINEQNDRIADIAKQGFERVVYLGSGSFKGLAQESSLKLLELTSGGVATCFDSPLAFRHGPKTFINDKTLLVLFISNDPHTRKYDLDLLDELRQDGLAGKVIALTAQLDECVMSGEFIEVKGMTESSDIELVFPYICYSQIYAFHHSLALKLTVDDPCPGGEVNRVVQGVTIYKEEK